MAWIYEFDGKNIVRFQSQGGERSVFAAHWHSVRAMTIHKDRLVIAAETSIYSMSTQDATFTTIAQHWNGIRTLLSDGEELLVLADGGWYRMKADTGKYVHLYNFQPSLAVATIQVAMHTSTSQGVPVKPIQGNSSSGAYAEGSRMACLWSDNHYYMATIQQVLGGSQYKVVYDDGTASTVQENQSIPLIKPSSATVGQPILAVWKQAGRLYEARISQIKQDSAVIVWDDGGSTSEVTWNNIVPR
jgi:hypothetical protein